MKRCLILAISVLLVSVMITGCSTIEIPDNVTEEINSQIEERVAELKEQISDIAESAAEEYIPQLERELGEKLESAAEEVAEKAGIDIDAGAIVEEALGAAGVLPETEAQTKSETKSSKEIIKDAIEDVGNAAKDAGKNAVDSAKEAGKEALDSAKESAEDAAKGAAEKALGIAEEKVTEAMDEYGLTESDWAEIEEFISSLGLSTEGDETTEKSEKNSKSEDKNEVKEEVKEDVNVELNVELKGEKAKVIFDTDQGYEDETTKALETLQKAHAAGIVDILGVCTTGSRYDGEYSANAVIDMLSLNSLENEIPVYAGTSSPLLGERDFDAEKKIRGQFSVKGDAKENAKLWTGNKHSEATPAEGSPAEFYVKAVKENPGEVTIITTGSLTNVAVATKLYPDFAKNVKEIIIVGGILGNNEACVTNHAEYNFFYDPESVKAVFNAGFPSVKLITLDNIADYEDGCDLLSVVAFIDEDSAKESKKCEAAINTDFYSLDYGALSVWDSGKGPEAGTAEITVLSGFDLERVSELSDAVCGYEKEEQAEPVAEESEIKTEKETEKESGESGIIEDIISGLVIGISQDGEAKDFLDGEGIKEKLLQKLFQKIENTDITFQKVRDPEKGFDMVDIIVFDESEEKVLLDAGRLKKIGIGDDSKYSFNIGDGLRLGINASVNGSTIIEKCQKLVELFELFKK